MEDLLQFGGGGVATLTALFLARMIYAKWLSNDNAGKTKRTEKGADLVLTELRSMRELLETRFSQQHDDLKAIKKLGHACEELGRWLKECHDARDEDGSFKWWNKPSIENIIRDTAAKLAKLRTMMDERQADAHQAKEDIIGAINARRRTGD